MVDDKEQEIQLQFLDEALDHLQTLESIFMGLSSSRIDGTALNGALRAAHSMKGGGSLMGFPMLGRLAHRLEDGMKVLKIQKDSIDVDERLEYLLLSAVDCLRSVVEGHHRQLSPSEDWLTYTASPIFDELYDRLGEPSEEDADSVLAPEDGADILSVLFESEVDGCLQRIEDLLETDDKPCLHEELLILAQELGGLGAMLQLDAFCHLCASIAYALQLAPTRTLEIAYVAVTEWRRSQSLVLTEQLDLLPRTIEVPGLDIQISPDEDPTEFLAMISVTQSDEDYLTSKQNISKQNISEPNIDNIDVPDAIWNDDWIENELTDSRLENDIEDSGSSAKDQAVGRVLNDNDDGIGDGDLNDVSNHQRLPDDIFSTAHGISFTIRSSEQEKLTKSDNPQNATIALNNSLESQVDDSFNSIGMPLQPKESLLSDEVSSLENNDLFSTLFLRSDERIDSASEETELESDIDNALEESQLEPDIDNAPEESELESDIDNAPEESEPEPELDKAFEDFELEPEINENVGDLPEASETEPDRNKSVAKVSVESGDSEIEEFFESSFGNDAMIQEYLDELDKLDELDDTDIFEELDALLADNPSQRELTMDPPTTPSLNEHNMPVDGLHSSDMNAKPGKPDIEDGSYIRDLNNEIESLSRVDIWDVNTMAQQPFNETCVDTLDDEKEPKTSVIKTKSSAEEETETSFKEISLQSINMPHGLRGSNDNKENEWDTKTHKAKYEFEKENLTDDNANLEVENKNIAENIGSDSDKNKSSSDELHYSHSDIDELDVDSLFDPGLHDDDIEFCIQNSNEIESDMYQILGINDLDDSHLGFNTLENNAFTNKLHIENLGQNNINDYASEVDNLTDELDANFLGSKIVDDNDLISNTVDFHEPDSNILDFHGSDANTVDFHEPDSNDGLDTNFLESEIFEDDDLVPNAIDFHASDSNTVDFHTSDSNALDLHGPDSNTLESHDLDLNTLESHDSDLNTLESHDSGLNTLESHDSGLNTLESYDSGLYILEFHDSDSNTLESNNSDLHTLESHNPDLRELESHDADSNASGSNDADINDLACKTLKTSKLYRDDYNFHKQEPDKLNLEESNLSVLYDSDNSYDLDEFEGDDELDKLNVVEDDELDFSDLEDDDEDTNDLEYSGFYISDLKNEDKGVKPLKRIESLKELEQDFEQSISDKEALPIDSDVDESQRPLDIDEIFNDLPGSNPLRLRVAESNSFAEDSAVSDHAQPANIASDSPEPLSVDSQEDCISLDKLFEATEEWHQEPIPEDEVAPSDILPSSPLDFREENESIVVSSETIDADTALERDRATNNPLLKVDSPTTFKTAEIISAVTDIQPIAVAEESTAIAPVQETQEIQATEFQILNPISSGVLPEEDNSNTFVRVGSKRLNQLNDLFGELTIARNGLTLHLKRLRDLVKTLNRRVKVLDQANEQLRSIYDQGATAGVNEQVGAASQNIQLYGKSLALHNLLSHPLLEELANSVEDGDINFDNTAWSLDNKFDALEMDNFSSLHHVFQTVMEGMVQIQEVAEDLDLNLDDSEQSARNLNKTARQLQVELMHVRMRPLSDIVSRFPRALRELSLKHKKPVEFKLNGGNTLIDRTILDNLSEPLMHLIRNAFDHGLEDKATRQALGKPEVATVEIRASHQGNRTIISVSDDGQGIALDKVRARARQMGLDEMLLAAASEQELLSLIFEPGFSTAAKTTDLSGRGVGMDVVRDRLQYIHGDIKISTRAGKGTTFTLSVPLTLSVTKVLLAESNGMLVAIPTDTVEEMIVLDPEQIMTTVGREVFEYDGKMAELIRLDQWLQFYCPRTIPDPLETPASIKVPSVLIVRRGNQVTGIQVERSWNEQEVTVRRVAGVPEMPAGFSSCTILGDGRVVPLMNIPALLHWIMSNQRTPKTSSSMESGSSSTMSESVHYSQPTMSSSHTFPPANRHSPSSDVASLQTGNSAYPPVVPTTSSQSRVLPSSYSTSGPSPQFKVLPEPDAPTPYPMFSGPSVSSGTFPELPVSHTTPLTLQRPQRSDSGPQYMLTPKPQILIVDDSIAVRRLLALTLEKAAYRVEQAKDGQDALEKLNTGLHIDALICDIEMPRLDGYRLLAKIKASDQLKHVPVMILTSRSGEKHRKLAMSLGAIAYLTKPYNEQSLVQRLADITQIPA